MASKPVANGYKANYALTEASRYSAQAMTLADRMMREIDIAQESLGRPDFSRIRSLAAQVLAHTAHTSRHVEDMRKLRAQAAQPVGEEVMAQLSDLQAEVAELRDQVARMNDPVYPRGYRQ